MAPPHMKHYPHIFSPMQMLYNYANNIKSSISEFFRQYLRPEGKEVLLLFNRYMIIVILLNLDVMFFLAFCVILFIVIKLVKIRPWVRDRGLNLPWSYVNALYEVKKRDHSLKCSEKPKNTINFSKLSKKSNITQDQQRKTILLIEQKQQILQSLTSQQQIGYFHPLQIQQYIYYLINTITSAYCKIVWYIKWKSIGVLWIITGLVYLLQPSNQYDTFKIKTSKNGALEIGEVKKASEIINYFYLVVICIVTNIVLFYLYGTKQLKNQLFLQVYTRQYTYNMIKNRRLRVIKSHMNADHREDSEKGQRFDACSQFAATVVNKAKQGRVVDLQELKDFASSSQQKSSPIIQVPQGFSQRKFSHDLPILAIQTPPKTPISNPQNIQIEQLLEFSKVESEAQIDSQQDQQEIKLITKTKSSDLIENRQVSHGFKINLFKVEQNIRELPKKK